MTHHVLPVDDLREHQENSTCECCPKIIFENGDMIIVHNSFDGRERNEKVPTNVTARNGDMIYVGDKLESVQGTKFTVVIFEGEYCVQTEDGSYYELKPYMSPNLWII